MQTKGLRYVGQILDQRPRKGAFVIGDFVVTVMTVKYSSKEPGGKWVCVTHTSKPEVLLGIYREDLPQKLREIVGLKLLSVCLNGQIFNRWVCQLTAHHYFSQTLKAIYDAPVDYKCEWWSLENPDGTKIIVDDSGTLPSCKYLEAFFDYKQPLQVEETPLVNPFEVAIEAVLDCWNNDQPKTREGEGVYWDYREAIDVQVERFERLPTFESTLELCFERAKHRVKTLSN